jgi:hypothetical protein
LVLGNKISRIEESAFEGCEGLTCDLVIPESIRFIGPNAFKSCSFNSITFQGKVYKDRESLNAAIWNEIW